MPPVSGRRSNDSTGCLACSRCARSRTNFYYEPQVRLAETLAGIVPIDGPVRSFFGNSGTEATEAAIKLARYYTKRPNIVAFFGAFHGRSLGSLSLTASKAVQR